MTRMTFISDLGERRDVVVAAGTSVMQAAVGNGVDGIIGECGGSAMCATCHVYVDEAFLDRLPPVNPTEDAMLDSAASERRANSRLGCQIRLTDELDGLVVTTPAAQF